MEQYKIGDKFIPWDNSWCINIETGEDCNISPAKFIPIFNEWCTPDEIERNATFTIVSNVYSFKPETSTNEYDFINVKSDKTGNVYRTLI